MNFDMNAAKWLVLLLATISQLLVTGCKSREAANRYNATAAQPPAVDPKYSLTADRQAIEALRSEVPVERKVENDEEALLLHFFSEVKRTPQEIRSTFAQMLRKKRELLDRDLKREREEFNRTEKKNRDDFLKAQSKARDGLKSKAMDRSRRDDFFKEQDFARKTHFANEREKRDDFESQIREKRKNFEDYSRSRTSEFNAEMRAYQKKFDDLKAGRTVRDTNP